MRARLVSFAATLCGLVACTARDTGSLDLLAASAIPEKHDHPPPPPPPGCAGADACTPCERDLDCSSESGQPRRCDAKRGVCVACAPERDGAPPPPGCPE